MTADGSSLRVLLAVGRVAGGGAAVAALVAICPRDYQRLSMPKLRQQLQGSHPDDALLHLRDERIDNVASVADRTIRWVTGAMTVLAAAVVLAAVAALLV